jgi:hypothetical protein
VCLSCAGGRESERFREARERLSFCVWSRGSRFSFVTPKPSPTLLWTESLWLALFFFSFSQFYSFSFESIAYRM